MRALSVIGILLMIAGAVLVVINLATGEMKLVLILFIIPVVYGSGVLPALAMAMLLMGFILFIFSWGSGNALPHDLHTVDRSDQNGERTKKEFGGVVLIGPVPIVFGSNKRLAMWVAIGAVLLLLGLVLALLLAVL